MFHRSAYRAVSACMRGPLAADQQRRSCLARAAREVLAVPRLVVLPFEIDVTVTKQWLDDLHGLVEAGYAMIERQPERLVLRLVPSCADAQDQAPAADFVGGRRHLRQDRRIAEGIAQHQHADLHAPGRLSERGQHGPGFPYSPRGLTGIPVQEVVGEPEAVEAIRFCLLRDRTDRLIRTLGVGLALVDQVDQQPDLHRAVRDVCHGMTLRPVH